MKTFFQLIAAAFFVYLVALMGGALTGDLAFAFKLTTLVTAIVAPLTVALYHIVRFVEWWNQREIVHFRRAKREIIRLRSRALAKLEAML